MDLMKKLENCYKTLEIKILDELELNKNYKIYNFKLFIQNMEIEY